MKQTANLKFTIMTLFWYTLYEADDVNSNVILHI